jgi:hypothetical protein
MGRWSRTKRLRLLTQETNCERGASSLDCPLVYSVFILFYFCFSLLYRLLEHFGFGPFLFFSHLGSNRCLSQILGLCLLPIGLIP